MKDDRTRHEATSFKAWKCGQHGRNATPHSDWMLNPKAFPVRVLPPRLQGVGCFSNSRGLAVPRSHPIRRARKGGDSDGRKGGHTMRVEVEAVSTCPPSPSCRVVCRACRRIRRNWGRIAVLRGKESRLWIVGGSKHGLTRDPRTAKGKRKTPSFAASLTTAKFRCSSPTPPISYEKHPRDTGRLRRPLRRWDDCSPAPCSWVRSKQKETPYRSPFEGQEIYGK
mmetsp:Transcript_904/g.5688  ORF Transcript_904/g.5688 Transcript_904/m.5688 type:complete len:224 (+) Transcript_904:155-826(+)